MIRALTLFVVLCSLVPAARVRSAYDSEGIAQAIEAQIYATSEPESAEIRGLQIAWSGVIKEFYAQREFRPVWDREPVVADLLRALSARCRCCSRTGPHG